MIVFIILIWYFGIIKFVKVPGKKKEEDKKISEDNKKTN
jgi:hypothetical protein